jgi:hypothetical protein
MVTHPLTAKQVRETNIIPEIKQRVWSYETNL